MHFTKVVGTNFLKLIFLLHFPLDPNSNAKWIVNIKWEMQGIDVHLDTNIGKRLSALGHTLTSLAGDEDEEFEPTDERLDVSLEDMNEQANVSILGVNEK